LGPDFTPCWHCDDWQARSESAVRFWLTDQAGHRPVADIASFRLQQRMQVDIRDLAVGDRDAIAAVDGGNGWNASAQLWARYSFEQEHRKRVVAIAWNDGAPVGYGTLIWESPYENFRQAGIPEINNLSAARAVRNRGIATALIRHFERCAATAGRTAIGLGFGLYADYGPAQRLYFRLGYRPDGRGITYANKPVAPGESVRLDDDLVLWLTKSLHHE
jgi:GNAT superfamily N-acetyltransferase